MDEIIFDREPSYEGGYRHQDRTIENYRPFRWTDHGDTEDREGFKKLIDTRSKVGFQYKPYDYVYRDLPSFLDRQLYVYDNKPYIKYKNYKITNPLYKAPPIVVPPSKPNYRDKQTHNVTPEQAKDIVDKAFNNHYIDKHYRENNHFINAYKRYIYTSIHGGRKRRRRDAADYIKDQTIGDEIGEWDKYGKDKEGRNYEMVLGYRRATAWEKFMTHFTQWMTWGMFSRPQKVEYARQYDIVYEPDDRAVYQSKKYETEPYFSKEGIEYEDTPTTVKEYCDVARLNMRMSNNEIDVLKPYEKEELYMNWSQYTVRLGSTGTAFNKLSAIKLTLGHFMTNTDITNMYTRWGLMKIECLLLEIRVINTSVMAKFQAINPNTKIHTAPNNNYDPNVFIYHDKYGYGVTYIQQKLFQKTTFRNIPGLQHLKMTGSPILLEYRTPRYMDGIYAPTKTDWSSDTYVHSCLEGHKGDEFPGDVYICWINTDGYDQIASFTLGMKGALVVSHRRNLE